MIDLLEERDESGKVHDSIIDVDGVLFHKASVLKQTFVRVKVSKDRLRRVQGLSKTMGKKEDLNLYNLIMKGDILIFPDNKKHVLGQKF